MSNEDFRGKIEEHRQTIEEEESAVPSRMSRTNRNPNNKKKKGKNPLMTILLIVFIFIPLTILFYVWFFYEPKADTEVTKNNTVETVVEVEKNDNTDNVTPTIDDEKDKEDEAAGKAEQEQAEKDAKKLAEQKAADEKAAEEERKAEEEKKKLENAKTHVVQSNETLYRIAMNYYGDPSGVDKIKSANGLNSENISVGQTLIIPE